MPPVAIPPGKTLTKTLGTALTLLVLAAALLLPSAPVRAQSASTLVLTLNPGKLSQAPGKPILADYSALNQGKKKQTFHLRFLLSQDAVPGPDDRELNSVLVRDLSTGQSAAGTAPLRLPMNIMSGPMHLLLVATPLADPAEYLAQTGTIITVTTQAGLPPAPGQLGATTQTSPYYQDTTPNTTTLPSATTTPSYGSGCDLTPTWLSLNPERPWPGSTVRVIYEVLNQGTQTAPLGELEIYLGPSPVTANQAVSSVMVSLPSLQPGQSHAGEARIPLAPNLARGTWYLGIIVDPTARLSESNETNNVRSVSIVVN